ncbi:MAG: hypothetical protein IPJ98_05470 [Bryobacterales bacterium]|nr:hypothetical protein [Bryobacterales bacterium]
MLYRSCVLIALLASPSRSSACPAALAGGLIDDRNWVRFGLADGLPSEQVLDLIELPSGEVWVRTTAGLAWFDGYTFHPITPEHGLPDHGFLAFSQDLSGGLWALFTGGIYAGGSRGFQRLDVPFPHDEPGAAYAAPLGTKAMLIVGRTGRTYLWDGRHLSTLPPELRSLPWASRRLHTTRSEAAWLSTHNGIYRVSDDSHTLVLPAPPAAGGSGHPIDIHALDGAPGHGASLAVNITPFQVGYWEWMPGSPPRQIPEMSGHVISALAVAPSGERVVVNRDGEILTGPRTPPLRPSPPRLPAPLPPQWRTLVGHRPRPLPLAPLRPVVEPGHASPLQRVGPHRSRRPLPLQRQPLVGHHGRRRRPLPRGRLEASQQSRRRRRHHDHRRPRG